MGLAKKFLSKTAAAAMALSMIFSSTAFAAEPLDELNEILAKQEQSEQTSLLQETLGFSDDEGAGEEKGLQFKLNLGIPKETASIMELENVFENGCDLYFGMQVDPTSEKWTLDAGASSEEGSVLDINLYGNAQKLALTIPQFFTGAVSLYAGNIKEQFEKSAFPEIFEIEDTSSIPDIDIPTFYPHVEDMENLNSQNNADEIEELLTKIIENAKIEKVEDGDAVVYELTCKTEDVMNVYREIFDKNLSWLTKSGLLQLSDNPDFDGDLDQMIDEMQSMFGEEVEVSFVTKDELLLQVKFDLDVDNSDFVVSQETESEADGKSEASSDTIITADEEFKGTVTYEFTFIDPENPNEGFDFNLDVTDLNDQEMMTAQMAYRVTREGNKENTTIDMTILEEGKPVYTGQMFSMTFDADTGDLDVTIAVQDENAGDTAEIMLDSTFSDIVSGESFVWTVDELSIDDGSEKVSFDAELSFSNVCGEITDPEDEREVLALSQEDAMTLISEIFIKAQSWSSQFAPEEETELMETEVQ
ncbi:MAG: hypothetical protein Q4C50_07635 [Eubacteriales bacterium]|nr:hypothetical protein [Eubacteriales bacterium]